MATPAAVQTPVKWAVNEAEQTFVEGLLTNALPVAPATVPVNVVVTDPALKPKQRGEAGGL